MSYNIEYQKTLSMEDRSFIAKKIAEETANFGIVEHFGFFMRNDNNEIVAGCSGYTVYGKIYTDKLWVQKEYRKMGFGRRLLESVHKLGIEKNCNTATVSTMSFQNTLEFYKKLGYEIDFERSGYTNDAKAFFLAKKLV